MKKKAEWTELPSNGYDDPEPEGVSGNRQEEKGDKQCRPKKI